MGLACFGMVAFPYDLQAFSLLLLYENGRMLALP